MSRNSIAVGHEELGRFIREVLIANGARAKDAAIVAEGLVWANLRGGDGHGVSRLPRYLNIIAHGEIDTKAVPTLSHDRAATFVLDCHHGFGPVAVMQAAALAVERAKKAGVCFGLVRETTHTGAIGRYAQWIAEQRLRRDPHGRRADLDGLSRRAGREPVDQSRLPSRCRAATARSCSTWRSSAIANGKILQARNTGEPLPEDTVLTADGEPTTDPKKAEILLPLGGPKGSGLGLMFEMLASVLASRADPGPRAGPGKARPSHRQYRDARHRHRNLPAARRLHPRCRRA